MELVSAEAERLAADPEAAEEFRKEVRPLLERLPAPLRARAESLSMDSPESLRNLLQEAQDLVLAQLAAGEEDP